MSFPRRSLLAAGLALAAVPARANPFADKMGQRRLLLLFGPDIDAEGFKLMVAQTRTPRFRMRDLDRVEVGEDVVRINDDVVSTPTADEVRRHFDVRPGRTAIRLVGKDGEVKLAESGPLRIEEVYDLIDSMPMRQQEMRERGEVGTN